jgi:hypothetical protein
MFTNYMASSGEFVRTYGLVEPQISTGHFLPVYNPGVLDHLRGEYAITKSDEESEEVIAEFRQCLDSCKREISTQDIAGYAEILPSLAESIRAANAHCLLGPLRGASRPCATVEVMTRQEVQYQYFNYQNHTNPERQREIFSDLTSLLASHDPGEDKFNILVTDTAIGGYGINYLATVLRAIRESDQRFLHQKWNVQYHVLHAQQPGDNLNRIKAVERSHNVPGMFEVTLTDYVVPSLIIEDYDPALAVKFDGLEIKPCATPGKFLLKQNGKVHVVETENARLTFDEFFSIAATEEMIHSADYKQIGSVWEEYKMK